MEKIAWCKESCCTNTKCRSYGNGKYNIYLPLEEKGKVHVLSCIYCWEDSLKQLSGAYHGKFLRGVWDWVTLSGCFLCFLYCINVAEIFEHQFGVRLKEKIKPGEPYWKTKFISYHHSHSEFIILGLICLQKELEKLKCIVNISSRFSAKQSVIWESRREKY